MNINVNIRHQTKFLEKRWYTFKISRTLAANYPVLQNLVPNNRLDLAIWSK